MTVKPSVTRRSPKGKGYFTRWKGRLVFRDKSKPRINQRQG